MNRVLARRPGLRRFADDLLQDARCAAVVAVSRFDPARATAGTFLGRTAGLALRRCAKGYATSVHVPAHVWERDRENVFLRRALFRPVTFATGEDDAHGVPEPADEREPDPAEVAERRVEVAAVLAGMSDIERRVVTLRYGLEDGRERRFGEIGAALGVTAERARQVHKRALERARRAVRLARALAVP